MILYNTLRCDNQIHAPSVPNFLFISESSVRMTTYNSETINASFTKFSVNMSCYIRQKLLAQQCGHAPLRPLKSIKNELQAAF